MWIFKSKYSFCLLFHTTNTSPYGPLFYQASGESWCLGTSTGNCIDPVQSAIEELNAFARMQPHENLDIYIYIHTLTSYWSNILSRSPPGALGRNERIGGAHVSLDGGGIVNIRWLKMTGVHNNQVMNIVCGTKVLYLLVLLIKLISVLHVHRKSNITLWRLTICEA